MLLTLFLIPLGLKGTGLRLDTQALNYFAPIVLYILLFSILPHKELRFIFNMIAALGVAKAYRRRQKSKLALLFVSGCLLVTFAASLVFLGASYHNYPGGNAFARLHQLGKAKQFQHIKVHIDVPAAMTGVSRFGQLYPAWSYVFFASYRLVLTNFRYNKSEDLKTWKGFDFLLTSDPKSKKGFKVIDQAFDEFRFINLRQRTIETSRHTFLMQSE